MTNKIHIMNQTEAAAYISAHYRQMDGSGLSRLTNFGQGPAHEKKGNQKIFLRRDVDAWIDEQRQKDETPEPNP